MQIHLLCIGTRMFTWVNEGFKDYAVRLPRECSLQLREFPIAKSLKSASAENRLEHEGRRLIAAIPEHSAVVALDVKGKLWDTDYLAATLSSWLQSGRDVAMLVGGPDGLSRACLRRAEYCWSLSPLTLPHGLVRVIVAEQLYRAWSILHNHPYHRR